MSDDRVEVEVETRPEAGAEPAVPPNEAAPDADAGALALAPYLWAAQIAADRLVLDVPCRTGYGAAILSRAGAASVLAADADFDRVGSAIRRHADVGEFAIADLHALPHANDQFTLVTCIGVLSRVADQARVLDELRRVTAPHGFLIASCRSRGIYPPGDPVHFSAPSPEQFEALLSERFENVKVFDLGPAQGALIGELGGGDDADPEKPLEVDVRNAVVDVPGGAPELIAIAGDAELPPMKGVMALSASPPGRHWLDSAAAWESRARKAEAAAGADRIELNHARNLLDQYALAEARGAVDWHAGQSRPGPLKRFYWRARGKLRSRRGR